jgi:hypothetical protein
MKRFLSLMLLLLVTTAISFAQKREITGKVIESDTKSAVAQTTVQLLRSDSSFVGGTVTSNTGTFKIEVPKNGRYILRISYVGYKTMYKSVNIASADGVALGTITLNPDAIMLKGATITAHLAKVQMKEDTFIYNADAYRIPEGSVLEELVKKLPGATVSDDGTIKINGKEVKKILVEGKEFFTGDTKTAMKNIPTTMVDKIKAYDQKSDLAKVTGIDDGEEQTVLDIGVKPGMKKGMFTNNDLGIGTENRYSARLMGARFSDKLRIMGFGNANNTNDMGFPGGGGGGNFGGGRQGLNASKMFGVNFNYDDNKKFQMDGSVRWNHSDADAQTKSSTENFVKGENSFSNSTNNNMSRSNSWNANMRLEWKPDTMTNIMFRPTMSYSTSDNYTTSESGTFNVDPYKYSSDPLGNIDTMTDSLRVNHRKNASISYSNSKSFGGEFQYNRKLNNMGRNVTLRATGNYGEGDSKSLSTSNVELYHGSHLKTDTTYQTNRYSVTPTKNWNYSVEATYSEPIMKATFLQFTYQFQYKYTKSDRATYKFDNLGDDFFSGLTPSYGGWDNYLMRLANPYTNYEDKDLSRYSEYKNYIHDIQLMLRVIRTNYNFNVGVRVIPQTSHFIQDYQSKHTDTTRTVTNITPTMDFRYKFSKTSQLRVNYRGDTSQPSMSDLLDITDNSDPLNITKGNPGLKPSFTNSLRIFYNNYIQSHQRAIYANLSASTTNNSISNMVTYDATTGGRTTQPQNINGNWNAEANLMYNMAIDTAGYWNISTFTNISYTNSVGFYNDSTKSIKNTTKTTAISERLSGGYRNDWFEFGLNGNVSYNHSRNMLQSSSNLDTWLFSYGASTNITLPWGTSIASDISMSSRRGYNDASMNTNELIWNAQLSHSFLSGKPLTVSLQFYDILKQQSNYSRIINATTRSDTEYNSITSYAMLHVIYRMNMFGSKQARANIRNSRRGMGEGDGPGSFGGEHQRGNHGGGGFGGGPM